MAVVGAGALLGGLCLASGSMVVCDQLLYVSAATSKDHATYADYDFNGRLRTEANRANWEATSRARLAERRKDARTNAEKRAVWEKFLKDHPGSPLQAELEELLRTTPPR